MVIKNIDKISYLAFKQCYLLSSKKKITPEVQQNWAIELHTNATTMISIEKGI